MKITLKLAAAWVGLSLYLIIYWALPLMSIETVGIFLKVLLQPFHGIKSYAYDSGSFLVNVFWANLVFAVNLYLCWALYYLFRKRSNK